jgi:hypothetical protein
MATDLLTQLSRPFPRLVEEGFSETSPATSRYNCLAWAAGRTDQWWWPDRFGAYYWPEAAPREETTESFVRAFETLGYARCLDGGVEAGHEKVALYVRDGKPTHAARQLPDGTWTSKLGRQIDIRHTLNALNGPAYGQIVVFLKRPLPAVG